MSSPPPVNTCAEGIRLMKAYKALQCKKPTAAYKSGSARFPDRPATITADYNPKGMGFVVKKASKSGSARFPDRPATVPADYNPKGMGFVVKKASGSFASHIPRFSEDKSPARAYYDKRGGVGDVTKAPKASSWARSSTTRPVYKSKTPDFLNPVDPSLKSNRSAKASFATQSERLPSYGSIVPGPGAYASPYVGAGMSL